MKKESLEYYIQQKYYKGKGVIITGATGGIGSYLLSVLVELGARVVAVVKDEKKLKEILYQKNINPEVVQIEKIDFKFDTNYRGFFSNIMYKLKGKLDVMFLCHGHFAFGEMIETTLKEYDEEININTRSVMAMISLATPFLKHTKGNVVVISSLESFIPVKGSFVNTISKSMVNMIIQNSALELASFGIRINGVAPGVTNTMLRKEVLEEPKEENNNEYMKKCGQYNLLSNDVIQPEDVVETMLFLGCDDANFVTGEIIKVDSGYSLNHDLSFSNKK